VGSAAINLGTGGEHTCPFTANSADAVRTTHGDAGAWAYVCRFFSKDFAFKPVGSSGVRVTVARGQTGRTQKDPLFNTGFSGGSSKVWYLPSWGAPAVERSLFRPSSTCTYNYLQVCGRLPSTCKYVQAGPILGWDRGLSADQSLLRRFGSQGIFGTRKPHLLQCLRSFLFLVWKRNVFGSVSE